MRFNRSARPLRLRIRTYLLLLVLGSAMPLVLLSAILAIRTAGAQDKRFGQDVVSVARALSLAVDSTVAPLQSAMEALGRSPALNRGDLLAFRSELDDAAALLNGAVQLSDAEGRRLLDSRDPPGVPASGRRALPEYVASVAAGGRPRVSSIYRSTTTGQLVATADAPVRVPGPDGAPAPGVLSVAIDLQAINELVRRQLLPDAWRGAVIDRDGRYLQRTRDNAAALGQPASTAWAAEAARGAPSGWLRSTLQDGTPGYVAFATSPATGWTVGIGVPAHAVRAPLLRTLASLLGLSAAFAVLGAALALLLARRVARPVDTLARLAADPVAVPPTGSSGIVELDEVARALRDGIAARGAMEAALRESEAELRAAIDLSPQVPWTADPAGRLLDVSERIGTLTGIPTARMRDGWLDIVHPEDRAGVEATWNRSVATGEPYDHEYRLRLANGGWGWFRTRAAARRDAAGRVVRWYGATEDVDARRTAVDGLQRLTDELETRVETEATAREAAQNRLNQAQRLQALGQLAGGVAHDFNNMLQVVGGALALIQRRPDDAARVARLAATAEDATERGAAITGRLLSLTRQGTLRAGPVEPLALLSDMASVLSHTLGAAIAIQVAAAPDLPPLLADRRQLETALINLAANARDAMPGGGRLTLSADLEFDPRDLSMEVLPGAFIRIEAADTGHGMDAQTLARASEPFFTTKDVGRGTGLGLAMARGFVEQSGGGLRIESAPNRGTVVALWLPCAPGTAAPPGTEPPRAPRRRGRVLLVEDDASVRATLAEQLQELGFRVLAAADGAAGLTLLMGGAEVAMLVSDLTMPGMDGVALIRAAQRMRPGLPAILLTGYVGGGAALDAAEGLDGPVSLMGKPVSASQLADRIATVVERRGEGAGGAEAGQGKV